MRQFGLIVLFISLSVCALWAEEKNKPAYQIADNSFFDPTRKAEKENSYEFSVDYRLEVGYAQD